MEKLKKIKDKLETAILSAIEDGVENVNTEELGDSIDMLKDLADAMYHCSIVDAMEKSDRGYGENENSYYTPMRRHETPYEAKYDPTPTYPSRKWYTENNRGYMGKSPDARRRYFETTDPSTKMQNLEDYAKTLNDDINEMVSGATENEKNMLRNKLTMMAQRI